MTRMITRILALTTLVCGSLLYQSAIVRADTTLKLAHASNEESLIQKAVLRFKDEVEKGTSGSVKIAIYPNAQLGDEGPISEGVGSGSIEIGLGGIIDAIDPKLGVITLPFLFKDFDAVHSVLDGPVGARLLKMGEDRGYHMLGFLDSGFRQFTNNRGPIEKPADLEGLKVRCPPNPVILATIKQFGALPQSIPYGEVYTALQSHVVDGTEAEIRDFYDQKWYEAQKYVSISNYMWTPNYWYMNKAKYDGLTSAERKVIDDAVRSTTAWYRSQLDSAYKQIFADLKAKGIMINALDDIKPFQQQAGPVYEQFSGEFGGDLVKAVREAGAK